MALLLTLLPPLTSCQDLMMLPMPQTSVPSFPAANNALNSIICKFSKDSLPMLQHQAFSYCLACLLAQSLPSLKAEPQREPAWGFLLAALQPPFLKSAIRENRGFCTHLLTAGWSPFCSHCLARSTKGTCGNEPVDGHVHTQICKSMYIVRTYTGTFMYKTHWITYIVNTFCRTLHHQILHDGKRRFTMSTCLPWAVAWKAGPGCPRAAWC